MTSIVLFKVRGDLTVVAPEHRLQARRRPEPWKQRPEPRLRLHPPAGVGIKHLRHTAGMIALTLANHAARNVM